MTKLFFPYRMGRQVGDITVSWKLMGNYCVTHNFVESLDQNIGLNLKIIRYDVGTYDLYLNAIYFAPGHAR